MDVAARLSLLDQPAIAPLEAFRQRLAAATGHRVPHVDPLGGGAAARLLILLETPGPGSDGPRFVSCDNPTGTARNLRRFLGEAGLHREDMVLWNAVPWIVHAPGARNRVLRRGEIAAGLAVLPDFLALLPMLRVVMLAGRVAAQARVTIAAERPGLLVLAMPHPSPTYVCTSPDVPVRIAAAFTAAKRLLDD